MESCGHFEWVAESGVVAAAAAAMVRGGRQTAARAVDIGCGTSTLPVALISQPGILAVVALDREQHCVEHMQVRALKRPPLSQT
eukprot:4072659-Pleurochrysis_carterae.AAC.1